MKDGSLTMALDQGTHASRAILVDSAGRIAHQARRGVALRRLDAHRVEQDAGEILASVRNVLGQALVHARACGRTIVAAGLATQRSSVLAWDADTGRPLGPVLSWQDTRNHVLVNALRAEAPWIRAATGLPLSAHYGASKLRWMVDRLPLVQTAARAGTLLMGPLSAWLLHRLLADHGAAVVDTGNASRTQLLDLRSRRWHPRLLETFGIDPRWLPQPVPVRGGYGTIEGTGIPLTACHGDQSAAALGSGARQRGDVAVNLGTGAFVVMDTGASRQDHERLLTGILDEGRRSVRYCLEGTVNGAGAAIDWLRHRWPVPPGLCWERVPQPPLFRNTVGGLGSPWWQPGGEPGYFGEQPDCGSRPERCLAGVMESITFLVQANLEAMQESEPAIGRLHLGGGLSSDDALCQRLADLSGIPVLRCAEAEITALGMARLANPGLPAAGGAGTSFSPHPSPALTDRYRRFVNLLESAHAGS